MELLTIFDDFPADHMKLFSELEVFSSQISFVEDRVGVLHGIKYSVRDYLRQSEIKSCLIEGLFNAVNGSEMGDCSKLNGP